MSNTKNISDDDKKIIDNTENISDDNKKIIDNFDTKMMRMDEVDLCRFFRKRVENKKIMFIKGNEIIKVCKLIDELIDEVKKETPEQIRWHECHEKGKALWEKLINLSLKELDPGAKGHNLFKYLKAATEFEDALYGLSKYYRDHMLHSIWVYLIGYKLMNTKLKYHMNHVDWYVFNNVESPKEDEIKDLKLRSLNTNETARIREIERIIYKEIKESPPKEISINNNKRLLIEDFIYLEDRIKFLKRKTNKIDDEEKKDLIKKVLVHAMSRLKSKRLSLQADELKDPIWCIISLCHDLGYSLSTLQKINEKVENVLQFIDMSDFNRAGYSLKIEQQFLTKQFLELMSDDMIIVEDPNGEEALIKLYRDDQIYWSLCDSLEKREHGILSSFVLYKLLSTLGATTVRNPGEAWGLGSDSKDDDDEKEALITLTRSLILFAMAQHEFKKCRANQLGSLADLLLLCDEVEEFLRWGRPVRHKTFVPSIAKVKIGFDIEKEKKVAIKIEYEVSDGQNVTEYFMRKANKICEKYSLNETDVRKGRVADPLRIEKIIMKIKSKKAKIDNHYFMMSNDEYYLLDKTNGTQKKLKYDYNSEDKEFSLQK